MKNFATAFLAVSMSFGLAGCETTATAGDGDGVDETVTTSSIAETRISGYSSPYSDIIKRYAKEYGVPVELAHAVVHVESSFRPDVRGAAGEIGLMQIKPATARMMGFQGSEKALFDPETNIKYGMMYLGKAHAIGRGTTCGTILKYNAGHAASRMNPISANYCEKIAGLIN